MTTPMRKLNPGELIGERYRIVKALGEGGSGIVYEATQLNISRQVVIKTLLPSLVADPVAYERFRREATVTANLNHPNIVTIYEFGRDEDLVYLAMEFVSGLPLGKFMRKGGPLPPRRVQSILSQILDALEAAHGSEIVHRDLKPANVLICRRGRSDFVKIIDFGIARELSSDSGQRLTQAGFLIGTPGYIAPELIVEERLSPAADLYSAGIMAYEMLTGTAAFSGGSSLDTVRLQMSNDPAPPPREIQSLPIWPIVERLYARDTNQRYASASEALDDIESIGAGPLSRPGRQHSDLSNPRVSPAQAEVSSLPTAMLSREAAVLPAPVVPVTQPMRSPGRAAPATFPAPGVYPNASPESSGPRPAPKIRIWVVVLLGLLGLVAGVVGFWFLLTGELPPIPSDEPAADTNEAAPSRDEKAPDDVVGDRATLESETDTRSAVAESGSDVGADIEPSESIDPTEESKDAVLVADQSVDVDAAELAPAPRPRPPMVSSQRDLPWRRLPVSPLASAERPSSVQPGDPSYSRCTEGGDECYQLNLEPGASVKIEAASLGLEAGPLVVQERSEPFSVKASSAAFTLVVPPGYLWAELPVQQGGRSVQLFVFSKRRLARQMARVFAKHYGGEADAPRSFFAQEVELTGDTRSELLLFGGDGLGVTTSTLLAAPPSKMLQEVPSTFPELELQPVQFGGSTVDALVEMKGGCAVSNELRIWRLSKDGTELVLFDFARAPELEGAPESWRADPAGLRVGLLYDESRITGAIVFESQASCEGAGEFAIIEWPEGHAVIVP